MKVGLISIDPGATNRGPTRSLGTRYLRSYARMDADLASRCEIDCHDLVLPAGAGRQGPDFDSMMIGFGLAAKQYDVIGFRTTIWNYYHVVNIARLVKQSRPETIVLAGGPQIAGERFPKLMLTGPDLPFDYLITGEGELAFVHLLRALHGLATLETCPGLWLRRPDGTPYLAAPNVRPRIEEIPSSFDFDVDEDLTNCVVILEASRGCPYQCEFCQWAATTARTYSLDRVFAEIDYALSHGSIQLWWADGTFNLDRKRRFYPIMEYLLDRLRHYGEKYGPEFHEQCAVSLELRPELITDACSDLLEQLMLLARRTTYEFGLQTTGELPGKLSGRPYHREKWISAMQRLGPTSRRRTAIDMIMDIPGNSLPDIADTYRTFILTGAREITPYRLHVLPGTPFEERAEELRMVYDPLPPHRPSTWLDRTPEEMKEICAFAVLGSAMTTIYRSFWQYLEEFEDPGLRLDSVLLGFAEWMAQDGSRPAVFDLCKEIAEIQCETDPRLPQFRQWASTELRSLFARYAESPAFFARAALDPVRQGEVRQVLAHGRTERATA